MRKLLLAAAAALMTIGAYAQYRPTFIVSAGYQGASLKTENNETKLASGARAGLDVDFGIIDTGTVNFSVRPGVHFSMKGSKFEQGLDLGSLLNTTTSFTDHLYYIDVPVLANVGFNAGEFGVFVNAGPYLGFGVGSSRTITNTTSTIATDPSTNTDRSETNLFGDNGIYKPFDWGIQLGAGVEFHRVLVGVGTQFGLGNISKSDNVKINNSDFFVTVGYRF